MKAILDPQSKPERWLMVDGRWSMVDGRWSMVDGRWSMVDGRSQRRERVLKVYINPNTNERIETKGGNHKVLKAWKAEFGADVVES